MDRNKLRMVEWLLLAAAFYVVAVLVGSGQPQIETAAWKLGHITSGAFLGYWIDRHLFGRVDHEDASASRKTARALVVSAAILGMAFGL